MTINSKIAKIDVRFNQDLKDIMKKRIALGKDDPLKPKSFSKLTYAITTHTNWAKIKTDIINHTFKEDLNKKNKRGQAGDLFMFMAIAIVVTLFFGLMIYGFGMLNATLSGINTPVGNSNTTIGQISDQTIGQVNTAFGNLRMIAIAMIIGMILNILLSSFLTQKHPAFIILYLLITIIAIVVSVPISNFYETLLADGTLGSTFASFTGSNYIILNLPFIVALIGSFGMVFMMIGIIKRPDIATEGVGV